MNEVVHFELPADDMGRAENFYSNVFGWKTQKTMPEYYMAYTTETDDKMMPVKPGSINGAIQMKNESANAPIIVINVDDIDSSLEKIKENGGETILEKMNVNDMLYYARFKDTEGNIVGLVQYMSKPM